MKRLPQNGVLVAVLLLAIGATAAGVAWWNNLSHTHRTLDFWGPRAAVLIRDAPHVTAARVAVDRPSGTIAVERSRDISHAKGLLHLRHALLDDRSFAWTASPSEAAAIEYALTFQREESRLTIYLSGDFQRLEWTAAENPRHSPSPTRTALSTEPIAGGLRRYFSDVFETR